MGGFGSGRWGWHQKKTCIHQFLVIDAARWMREGILREGSTCSRGAVFCVDRVDARDMTRPVVQLTYTASDRHSAPRHFDYPVLLETTRPHLGGLRWWFTCPRCGRRAQKLYHPPGGSRFGCRNCYSLSYRSRSYGPLDRSQERARTIQLRLGGSGSLIDPFPFKPKGMWWKTYERLRHEY